MSLRTATRAGGIAAFALALLTISLSPPADDASATGTPVQLAAGGDHTCVLTSLGGVRCWGNNNDGQLGDGSTEPSTVPVDVCAGDPCLSPLSGVRSIAAGAFHTCAVMDGGGAKCWGENTVGQVGNGGLCEPCTTPRDVCADEDCLEPLTGVAQIAAGLFHTCARMADETVQCWGDNGLGQLGSGDDPLTRFIPGDVCADEACAEPLDDIVSIDANFRHTCAIQERPFDQPPPVVGGRDGGNGAGIVFSARALMCWGDNESDQLGTDAEPTCFGPVGDDLCNNIPVDVCADEACEGALTGVLSVALGANHTCARMTGDTLKCWGSNGNGRLGISSSSVIEAARPMDVCANETCAIALSGVTAVTAGTAQTCAIASQTAVDGLKCWGANSSGQVGDGTKDDRHAPVDVCSRACESILDGVVAIEGGGSHTCAVAPAPPPVVGVPTPTPAAGSAAGLTPVFPDVVQCWGDNEFGQLGDGSDTQRTAPVVVSGIKPPPTATPPTPSPTPTVNGCSIGDANGDGEVSAIDAALILQFAAGLSTELPCPDGADVNGDGSVNALDAALVLQFVAGLISDLPP